VVFFLSVCFSLSPLLILLSPSTSSSFIPLNMPSNDGMLAVARSFRVLVIGGSYGGLSAALNLWDLSRGRLPRFNYAYDGPAPAHRIPIQTTIVDERDGYCTHLDEKAKKM
jgi:hypothetical protein